MIVWLLSQLYGSLLVSGFVGVGDGCMHGWFVGNMVIWLLAAWPVGLVLFGTMVSW